MERGLLLKGPLVNATLEDRKWQTRRIMKPQPPSPEDAAFKHSGGGFGFYEPATYRPWFPGQSGFQPGDWHVTGPVGIVRELCGQTNWVCPYGAPGDRLWVREAWAKAPEGGILYRATHPDAHDSGCRPKWKPGIHLHRVNARLVLEITRVRVERIQDITPEDAIAEGIEPTGDGGWWGTASKGGKVRHLDPVSAFRSLWDSINLSRGYGWDANPWVWVLDFKVIQRPHSILRVSQEEAVDVY